MLKAEQLTGRNGNAVMNHIVLFDYENKKTYLQSYDSIVAVVDRDRKVTLGCDWDYSKTTMKHLHAWMDQYTKFRGYSAADIRKAIDQGEISYDPEMK